MRTNKCNEVLYFEFTFPEDGPHAEPPALFQNLDELHFILNILIDITRSFVIFAIIRALGVRLDVQLGRRRHRH